MKIASAQLACSVGDMQQNLEEHYRLVQCAIAEHVDLIAFPEMSITGYCLEEGKELAMTNIDTRLFILKELSAEGNIHIVAGAPIRIGEETYIGAFIFCPNGEIQTYTKQHLHGSEEQFYASSMSFNPIIHLSEERVSLAICADITHKDHPRRAKENGGTIYLPCIFYSAEGIEAGHTQLKHYAERYALVTIMANFSGEHWNITAGGRSTAWDASGNLLASLGVSDSGLVIAEKLNDQWNARTLIATLHQ